MNGYDVHPRLLDGLSVPPPSPFNTDHLDELPSARSIHPFLRTEIRPYASPDRAEPQARRTTR